MSDLPISSLAIEIQNPAGQWIRVGVLRSQRDHNWFESFESYWSSAKRPVLGQIFEEKGKDWVPRTRVALPRWFSHLLPEGILRREMASAAQIPAVREFKLLEKLGIGDLPGAIRAVAITEDGEFLVPDLDIDSDIDLEENPLLKFSLAGVQLKFSVAADEKGPTVPISGKTGDSILKMPDPRIGFHGVPEAEHAAMTLARLSGLSVAPTRLMDAGLVRGLEHWSSKLPGNSLLVSRYDRNSENQRIHAEELAQVLDIATAQLGAKYKKANFETIANLLARLVGIDAVGEVIDRIVFNVMIGNGDAHLKNWSIVYPDGRIPALSPAYDLVPTVLYIENDDLGLNLNGSKEFSGVGAASFERLGEATGYGYLEARERATSMVQRVLSEWSSLSSLLPQNQYDILTARLSDLKVVKDS